MFNFNIVDFEAGYVGVFFKTLVEIKFTKLKKVMKIQSWFLMALHSIQRTLNRFLTHHAF